MPELPTPEDRTKTKRTNAMILDDYLGSDNFLDHLKQILPDHLNGERFCTIALRQTRLIPGLAKCTLASIAGSIMEAATLGLEIGTQGECWIIPRMEGKHDDRQLEASLQIGYLGQLALAYRSPKTKDVQCDVVCKGDHFKFQRGTDGYLRHVPKEDRDASDPKNITHAWSLVRTIDGGEIWTVMDKRAIERLRNSGPSGNSPAWRDWYDRMAMGKSLKQTLKFCPKTTVLGRAITIDDRNDANLRPDFAFDLPALPETIPEMDTQRAFRESQEQGGKGMSTGASEAPAAQEAEPEPDPVPVAKAAPVAKAQAAAPAPAEPDNPLGF